MMPACPPPAPNPFRAPPRPAAPSLVPVLWLQTRPTNMMPPVGRNWIN